ncbi:MAG: FISUMP domain-containing protein [Sediminibacterium sp.]
MKKTVLFFILGILILGFSISGCQKTVDTSAADITALKEAVNALQKRSDSLAAALTNTNNNLSALSKSIDSVKTQLAGIIVQINQLTTTLNTVGANITSINAQIATLNQQYADLLAKLNAIQSQLNGIPTIVIGTQTWTQKNLDISLFRNGDLIPEIKDPTVWASLSTPGWCYYNEDPALDLTYGKIYNWAAVNDPRGIAPVGYHIPTDAEWNTLATFLGGDSTAGGKLKETGTVHWNSPNTGATNTTNFTALPAGSRSTVGPYNALWNITGWWSIPSNNSQVSVWLIWNTRASLVHQNSPNSPIYTGGWSVRCVKD